MSDPIRWRASDGSAPVGARELLRHASAPKLMDAATRARHAAAVAKITAGAAPVVAAGAKMALAAKFLAGIGLAAVVAVGASPMVRERLSHRPPVATVAHAQRAARVVAPTPTSEPAVVEAPPVAVPETPVIEATPTPTSEPIAATPAAVVATAPMHHAHAVIAAPAPAPTVTPTVVVAAPEPAPEPVAAVVSSPVLGAPITGGASPTEPREDPLLGESRLLESARVALANNPQSTLALVDQAGREFPHGQQADEREFLAVQALRMLGRSAEARTRAEALIARFPESTVAPRARRVLNSLP